MTWRGLALLVLTGVSLSCRDAPVPESPSNPRPTETTPGAAPSVQTDARSENLEGRVLSVLGPIDPEDVGFTLPHEHLFVDLLFPEVGTGYPGHGPPTPALIRRLQMMGNVFWVPRTEEERAFWARPDLTQDMAEPLRRGWQAGTEFVLDDDASALEEVADFRAQGGRTIVDLTPVGIGRDPVRIREAALTSGVNVVMGTAWYRWPFHPPEIADLSADELADIMVREIMVGVGDTGVRAGIIGEIPIDANSIELEAPVSWVYPDSAVQARRLERFRRIASGTETAESFYHPDEIKVLRAGARASRRTGAAIALHAPDPWIAYLDVLEEEGVDLSRVVIGHGVNVMADTMLALGAFRRGAIVQVDYSLQTYPWGPVGNHELLLDRMAWAVERGFVDQLMVSLDVCLKVGRARWGGSGLANLHDVILPALRERGVSEAAIHTITVENPTRLLTFVAPEP